MSESNSMHDKLILFLFHIEDVFFSFAYFISFIRISWSLHAIDLTTDDLHW